MEIRLSSLMIYLVSLVIFLASQARRLASIENFLAVLMGYQVLITSFHAYQEMICDPLKMFLDVLEVLNISRSDIDLLTNNQSMY